LFLLKVCKILKVLWTVYGMFSDRGPLNMISVGVWTK